VNDKGLLAAFRTHGAPQELVFAPPLRARKPEMRRAGIRSSDSQRRPTQPGPQTQDVLVVVLRVLLQRPFREQSRALAQRQGPAGSQGGGGGG
jgi:hypothetical protein